MIYSITPPRAAKRGPESKHTTTTTTTTTITTTSTTTTITTTTTNNDNDDNRGPVSWCPGSDASRASWKRSAPGGRVLCCVGWGSFVKGMEHGRCSVDFRVWTVWSVESCLVVICLLSSVVQFSLQVGL